MPDGCNEKPKVHTFSGTGRQVPEIITHGIVVEKGSDNRRGMMD